MSTADEIKKLNDLRQSGAISEEEYQEAKASVLQNGSSAGQGPAPDASGRPFNVNQWSMFIHLSQLCGIIIIPIAGLILPIVLWQLKKDQSPLIDTHGKIVMNWIISEMIYAAVSFVLIFVVIGIPLLIAVGILGAVFPIIGGLKANNGEVWPYPLSIRFFQID